MWRGRFRIVMPQRVVDARTCFPAKCRIPAILVAESFLIRAGASAETKALARFIAGLIGSIVFSRLGTSSCNGARYPCKSALALQIGKSPWATAHEEHAVC
jgi:hypothetical protein